ncbi:MAG: hypothetical protein UR39_C0002G0116 [Candidatus Woesebacteria bacterium GW2011_GWA1_33_30]|uniref:Transcription regulator TrmB N-terminal domain-containing protein n=1 Tax=Candidatus Woesebacteria bacterium GW2011_GWA2_33_28 TaxID=1618561 RepID=A0A0F9ZUG5_9BACT|nr:MAG: hypothetical protein UR38_C0002G0116 [Candidatus Woesebacteria bacterium GW2011_GWA2_33_28]KKP48826.1 MAG: hypothetical protein UR39_C0002G0116 [Candidatus Woesebacteria bacterium GW2011_GWA1_33_30]KKP50099.1 MAG: hypothetical protein UR40_C0002G0116 [Microgenomates group bacterium GW2011_GWC1_33_32]KKP51870.1 MAG: hypothetical protein UR44_C0006G0116 [Candidatus Woesebacteria bacterium GW2011_GWB1_33_38]
MSRLWVIIYVMDKLQIIDQLAENYQLTDNQKSILKFLTSRDSNAEEILKATRISSGRIYKILRELEEFGIINKSFKKPSIKPSIYSMQNFSQNIRNFVDRKLKQSLSSQSAIISNLEMLGDEERIGILTGNKKESDIHIINMFEQAKWIRILHKNVSLPWFLYVFFDEKKFLQIRERIAKQRVIGSSPNKFDLLNKREAYLNLYNTKNVDQVMSRDALLKYKSFLKSDEIEVIKKNLSKCPNIKIHVLDHLITPFSVYLSDNLVLMPVFNKSNESKIIKMKGSEYVDIYNEYISSFITKSQDMVDIL